MHIIWIWNCFRSRQTAVTAAIAAAATEAQQPMPVNPAGMDLDIPVDPNEPTYCFCNQVSYGEMVACDNPDVCFTFSFLIFISILPTFHTYFDTL